MSDELTATKESIDEVLLEVKRWLLIAGDYVRGRAAEGDELAKGIADGLDSAWNAMTAEGIAAKTLLAERQRS